MKLQLIATALVLWVSALADAQTTRPTTQPSTSTSPRSLSADEVGQMLKPDANAGKSLQPLPERPTVDKSTTTSVKPNAPAVNVLREGTFVIDRVCRLTKTADGSQFELTFESDGKALRDPPMIILPNLKLMLMESAAAANSRDLKFRVTGMVTEYRGRNYILLEKVVIPQDVTQPLSSN